MSDEILIAGLGTVGKSVALALKGVKLAVGLVGYDPDPKVSREAVKLQVVDRVVNDLRDLPAESDLSILSLAPPEMIPALEVMAPGLREGALVIGVGPVQSPIVAWCADHLPAGRSYVGATLAEGAAAFDAERDPDPQPDRYSGGVMGLVLPHGVPQAAIDVAASLARILGAQPFFLDAAELDAAGAMTEGLPLLLAAALMNMSATQPGWRDARRLTGRTFAQATSFLAELNARPAARALVLSRTSLTAKLDSLISELSEWRGSLAAGDEEGFVRRMTGASEAHLRWLHARRKGDWGGEETRITPPVEGPNAFERLFGLGARRAKKPRG